MKNIIKIAGLLILAAMIAGCASTGTSVNTSESTEPTKTKKVIVDSSIQAIYSENPNWTEAWSTRLPATETTKWKVSEIWIYSDDELIFSDNYNANKRELEKKVQGKIPGSVVKVSQLNRETYTGFMPYNCKSALFVRLESRYCFEPEIWCETLKTSLLQEVYNIVLDSAGDFIENY